MRLPCIPKGRRCISALKRGICTVKSPATIYKGISREDTSLAVVTWHIRTTLLKLLCHFLVRIYIFLTYSGKIICFPHLAKTWFLPFTCWQVLHPLLSLAHGEPYFFCKGWMPPLKVASLEVKVSGIIKKHRSWRKGIEIAAAEAEQLSSAIWESEVLGLTSILQSL